MTHNYMTDKELNAAFEACEKMRKLNLEVECNELGIPCDHSKCKQCMLEEGLAKKKEEAESKSSSYFPTIRIGNPFGKSNKTEPCLLCASPTCSASHASKTFLKENVVLCLECESLFQTSEGGLEDDMAIGLQQQLERLTDAYDRAFLLLRYSSQFIPELVKQLQEEESRDDKVNLGTSSVGVMTGLMGFAGAAALLTPAGPPLLLASFVFGTSNAAVGLGYSANKYYWRSDSASPTQVANRLLTLYGFLLAAMERIVTVREQVQADKTMGNVESSKDAEGGEGRNAYLDALSQSFTVTRRTNTTLLVTSAAGYTASGSVFEAIGAAPVIGQAFSAAIIVLDYQTATSTLKKIQQGSVNEKAQMLQERCDLPALMKLPTTSDLEAEVQDILRAVDQTRQSVCLCHDDEGGSENGEDKEAETCETSRNDNENHGSDGGEKEKEGCCNDCCCENEGEEKSGKL
ncbi:hypothetical protein ACA910_013039 [Epithemia clementina (nom. ined.)]